MLTTFHFAFYRKFIEDLYAQVSGIFEQARVHAGVGPESALTAARRLLQVSPGSARRPKRRFVAPATTQSVLTEYG